jgi:hypothetical protein
LYLLRRRIGESVGEIDRGGEERSTKKDDEEDKGRNSETALDR